MRTVSVVLFAAFPLLAATVPSAPTITSAIAGNGSATIAFTAPSDNGGSPITAYQIVFNIVDCPLSFSQCSAAAKPVIETGPSSPMTFGGLVDGVTYIFKVAAANVAGLGPYSAPSPAVSPFAPIVISISPGGIVNSASFVAPVVPGSLASIFGTFPVTATATAPSPWPLSLSGLSVQLSGIQAPIYYASATQINVQVPWELSGQTSALVTASAVGVSSSPVTVSISPAFPGIFANSQGTAAVTDGDGNPFSATNPAQSGSTVVIYLTGMGAVSNTPKTGYPASATQLSLLSSTTSITIGGNIAPVQFAGLTPTLTGVYQINTQIPAGTVASAAAPIIVTTGGVTSKSAAIAIGTQAQPVPNLSGTWSIRAPSTLYGVETSGYGLLTQSGTTLSGDFDISGTPCAEGDVDVNGTVTGAAAQFTIKEGSQNVAFSGTVGSSGATASGTYSAPSGGCTNGDYGTWTASKQ